MTYLLVAALIGGAAGVWAGWPHGILACLVAAPVGASLFALLTAGVARWRLSRAPRLPASGKATLDPPRTGAAKEIP